MMTPLSDSTAAPAQVLDTAPAQAIAVVSLTSSTTPHQPTSRVSTTPRTDAAEIRRLRTKLLKLILQDQLRRDDQSHRGLPIRSVG